ncbi:unnamed protein product [Calypogeia fissa]
MAFLLPLLYREKSKRVIVKVGNIIIVSYIGEKVISWPKILEDLISNQVKGLTLKTPTSLASYLYDLYFAKNVMFKEEKTRYHTKKYMLAFGDPNMDVIEVSYDEEIEIAGPSTRWRLHPVREQGSDLDPDPVSRPDFTTSPLL